MTGLLQGEHPLILAPKSTTHCWFDRRRLSIANCGRMVTDRATVIMESPRNSIALSKSAIADPLPPKIGVPYAPNIREWPYLCNGWSDPLHVWFQGRVFGDGGSNGAIFDSNKFKMAATDILDNFEWPFLRNGSRSTYIARIARSSLR